VLFRSSCSIVGVRALRRLGDHCLPRLSTTPAPQYGDDERDGSPVFDGRANPTGRSRRDLDVGTVTGRPLVSCPRGRIHTELGKNLDFAAARRQSLGDFGIADEVRDGIRGYGKWGN